MAFDILVIDDDAIARQMVRLSLSGLEKGAVIHEAATGVEGARLLQERAFDCVFVDYNLPDIDGISLLRKVYNPDTDLSVAPVVMLTGQSSEAGMADALRWGAQDYLVKSNISTESLPIAFAKACEIFELKKSHRQAEEQLRHSQKMEAVGQLTSGVAHDFNNLLTVILGNSRLIQKRLAPEAENFSKEDVEKKIRAIEISARKGAELVRRLMIFTRQRELKQDVVDINACVQETYELLERTLGEMIEIVTIPASDPWPVNIDVGQFENALINLAVNARDAMPTGGRLTIETHNIILDDEYAFRHPEVTPGPYVMIAISDTGAGMRPEIVSRIFEPFFTTKPTGEGTGLGLSMVYGFIRQSGGHIQCYSEPGHGTVFRIYLPKFQTPDGAVEEGAVPALPEGQETILVVEDDPAVRDIAVSMLERLGYSVLQAQDARTALEILKREHRGIDLIFTDIVMPGGMSGADLVAKAHEYYPEIKALYTSGYSENAIPDYQSVVGEELIGKPYRKETLARKVRHILDDPFG